MENLEGQNSQDEDQLVLFSYFRSSCTWRVRIALEYKGLKYKIVPIQIMKKDQVHPDYLKVNPMGQVPALLINNGEKVLTQSIAILEYLEERYPDKPPLLPHDIEKRTTVRQICELIASGIQPLQNLSTLHKLPSSDDDEKLSWAQYWIHRGLAALESILVQTSGKCCVGDEVTLADCCLVPQVANAHRFKVDTTPFPTVNRIDSYLQTIPAFIKAHASNQPDCPPEVYSKL